MKRAHLALLLCPVVLAVVAIAASCSQKPDGQPLKAGGGKYYQTKDSGSEGGLATQPTPDVPKMDFDASALMDMQKEIKTVGQAFQVLMTAYDNEEREGEFGQQEATTPPMKAYTHDLIEGVKKSRSRLKALVAAKDVTLGRTSLTDRMKFESTASITHLTNIFKNMFNNAYMTRRIDAANNVLRMLDEQMAPLVADDEAFKNEIDTVRDEWNKRLDRAETVRTGLTDGIGGLDDGMFEDIDPPAPPQAPQGPQQPQQPQQQPQEPAPAADAGAAPAK
jgi:predicted outer membrane protein